MNADAVDSNGDNDTPSEFERLFAELAELKKQRNELQAALAECRRENRELRARLGDDA